MTTNDLIAALQDTLAQYQHNGTSEDDLARRLESQVAELRADVSKLQAALHTAQEEKRLLLETLREQSHQLLTLTQHVTTSAGVQALPKTEQTPVTSTTPTPKVTAGKAEDSTQSSQTTTSATKSTQKPATSSTSKSQKSKAKTAPKTPPSQLDRLWDMVREFNANKPFPERVRFDESLAINNFGITPQEWKEWYKGTNSAKVKRQPKQVRTNQRKAAKEGIEVLQQQWRQESPATASESSSKSAAAPTGSPTSKPTDAGDVTTTAEDTSPATGSKGTPKTEPDTTPTSAATEASSLSTTTAQKLQQKDVQALFELFQSWNQNENNAPVRFTIHTAAAFDGIDVEMAREWIEQHSTAVAALNEGVSPNNRRDARQALKQLKETWNLL